MDRKKKDRKKYETPVVVPLDDLTRGTGDCANGDAVVDTCSGGGMVVSGCVAGGIPSAVKVS